MGTEMAQYIEQKVLTLASRDYPYVVYLPEQYDGTRAMPVILFLYGAAERGTDGMRQTRVGIGPALEQFPERYPAIVVMPQCPPGAGWQGAPADAALAALEETIEEHDADADRLYLTGVSMGGFGSFLIASEEPDRFAAVVPICGGGSPESMADSLSGLPIWVFHGAADDVVPVERSREMVDAIQRAGGTRVLYTEYSGVGHESWERAYGEPQLPVWLFSQSRGAEQQE
jgi:predicted peptidase